MPQLLEDLHIDRVDLVDEGANSAAFIELYKRREPNSMNFDEILTQLEPEHATVITTAFGKVKADLSKALSEKKVIESALEKAKQEVITAQTEAKKAKENAGGFCTCKAAKPNADGICQSCGKPVKGFAKSKSSSTDDVDDEVLKSLPEGVQTYIKKCHQEAQDTQAKLAAIEKEKAENEAIAKAKALKALPVDAKDLVKLVKQCDDETYKTLQNINSAVEKSVLNSVGKSSYDSSATSDAYGKLETKAAEIRKSKPALSYAEAFTEATKQNPDLYEQYRKGE